MARYKIGLVFSLGSGPGMPFSKLLLAETGFQIKAVVYHLEPCLICISWFITKLSFKLEQVINMLKTKVKKYEQLQKRNSV